MENGKGWTKMTESNFNYSIFDIADWFLSKESMTPKKLQKLCYYVEAWGLALLNESVIDDTKFEAWVHGPVSPELYAEYSEYGWRDIPKKNKTDISEERMIDLLESVWSTYGDKSANELEILTHTETPWKNARKGVPEGESSQNHIDEKDMREYYLGIYVGG